MSHLVAVLRTADLWLRRAGRSPLIDFDLAQTSGEVSVPKLAAEILEQMSRCRTEITDQRTALQLNAAETFFRVQLGQQMSFDQFLLHAHGATRHKVGAMEIGTIKTELGNTLERLGLPWNEDTIEALKERHGVVPSSIADKKFAEVFKVLLPRVESWLDRSLAVEVAFESVEADAYWTYWVSGDTQGFKMKINAAKGNLSKADVVMAVIHELVSHGGQLASWNQRVREGQMDEAALITSVNGPEQFCLEGLAQSFLWFLADRERVLGDLVDPALLEADLLLYHYRELVKQMAFDDLIEGSPVEQCTQAVHANCPWIPEHETLRDFRALTSKDVGPYRYIYPISFRAFTGIATSQQSSELRRLVGRLFDDVYLLGLVSERDRWLKQ